MIKLKKFAISVDNLLKSGIIISGGVQQLHLWVNII